MMHTLKAGHEKYLLGLAVTLLAVACLWWWRQQGEIHRLQALPVTVSLTGASHEPANLKPTGTKPAPWPKAPVQSRGPGWLYEVFTPPVIYYNPLARSFTVTPPKLPTESGAPVGLALLDVRPELFRLQLAGYFGGPGGYLAAFTSPQSPETLRARAGRRFESLGLTLRSFVVTKIPVEHNDPWPVYEVAAQAVLADERTGGEVVLDSRARKYTGARLALLQTPAGGRPREVREGDTFSDDNSIYHVERIQLDPPEVVVARTVPGVPQPEINILRPAPKSHGHAGAPNRAKPFPDRRVQPLATNSN